MLLYSQNNNEASRDNSLPGNKNTKLPKEEGVKEVLVGILNLVGGIAICFGIGVFIVAAVFVPAAMDFFKEEKKNR